MGMDKFISSVISEAKDEAKSLIRKAENEARKQIEDAKSQTSLKLKDSEKQTKSKLEDEQRERIAWARLEKKRIISEAKEDLVNNLLEELYIKITALRKTKKYPKLLLKEAKRGLEEIGTSAVVLHVVKGDKKHFSSLKKNGISIAEDLKATGGLIIESKDKKVRVVSTLESLFELRKESLRKIIYESLFGGKK